MRTRNIKYLCMLLLFTLIIYIVLIKTDYIAAEESRQLFKPEVEMLLKNPEFLDIYKKELPVILLELMQKPGFAMNNGSSNLTENKICHLYINYICTLEYIEVFFSKLPLDQFMENNSEKTLKELTDLILQELKSYIKKDMKKFDKFLDLTITLAALLLAVFGPYFLFTKFSLKVLFLFLIYGPENAEFKRAISVLSPALQQCLVHILTIVKEMIGIN